MSQEILFLIFMIVELCSILLLYQVIIIPRMALAASVKTNNLFEQRMMDKTWDIPAMLEDYTAELLGQLDAHFFGFKPADGSDFVRGRIQKFYEGAAGKAAQAMSGDPASAGPQLLKGLQGQPWYVQAIASKFIGPALEQLGEPSTKPPVASYNPGLARK